MYECIVLLVFSVFERVLSILALCEMQFCGFVCLHMKLKKNLLIAITYSTFRRNLSCRLIASCDLSSVFALMTDILLGYNLSFLLIGNTWGKCGKMQCSIECIMYGDVQAWHSLSQNTSFSKCCGGALLCSVHYKVSGHLACCDSHAPEWST